MKKKKQKGGIPSGGGGVEKIKNSQRIRRNKIGKRGIGMKFSNVGIQGEVHMGKLEYLQGKKQAHLEMRGTVALIPFQIQDPEKRGEDKRLPYFDIFLLEKCYLSAVVISEKFPSKLGDNREVNIFHEPKTQTTLILLQT
jgi:hypothetical protein